MHPTRLHFPDTLAAGLSVTLPSGTSHHLITVLRLKVGDSITLFNASDGEYQAELLTTAKTRTVAEVGRKLRDSSPLSLSLTLCLGLSRGDRMNFAIQKATELGAQTIIPIYSEFSEVKIRDPARLQNKLQHWQRIAEHAAEQSDRMEVPTIKSPQKFGDALETVKADQVLIFDASGESAITDFAVRGGAILFTGPEGGFSPAELQLAREYGHPVVKLGPRILRTETAPLVALAVLQQLYGDFTPASAQ